ncbi:hypothetical protein CCACVL1_22623 [Corchorus capsularis]|uniref:Uncharacterized protein n=1 Tax=Corchorus capsularis TaxID=210143 RepID=A0A1R3GXP7_COCAP|nr:hypothetical protein CCACVL1_22623 [Corchorus capsularis]
MGVLLLEEDSTRVAYLGLMGGLFL